MIRPGNHNIIAQKKQQNLTKSVYTQNHDSCSCTNEDNMKWTGNKQGPLSMKSANGKFNTSNYQIGCRPWKMIWTAKIPYKDACFTWLLQKRLYLTINNLSKRGYHMHPRCYLVGSRVKTMAGQIWKFFYKLEDNKVAKKNSWSLG